jgi:hypothetical protein
VIERFRRMDIDNCNICLGPHDKICIAYRKKQYNNIHNNPANTQHIELFNFSKKNFKKDPLF